MTAKLKAKLALELLEKDLELLSADESNRVLGGNSSSGGQYWVGSDGYWSYSSSDGGYIFTHSGGSLEEATVTAFAPVNIQVDGTGRSYYIDRSTGRYHYVMDTGLLFEGISDLFSNFSTYAGAGYDLIRGALGLGTAGSIGVAVMDPVVSEWWNKYFMEGGYVGNSSSGYGSSGYGSSGYNSAGGTP